MADIYIEYLPPTDNKVFDLKAQALVDLLRTYISSHDTSISSLSSYSITWTNIDTFANNWVNYGGAQVTASYGKDSNGWVWIRGTIKDGSWSAKAFGLPSGHRPAATHTFTASCYNRVVANVIVQSDGDVMVYSATGSNDYIHLNGIGFYVG